MTSAPSEILTRILKPIPLKESFSERYKLESEIIRNIKVGLHPILIWQELLGLSDDEMAEALNVEDNAELRALKNNEHGAYFAITAEQVLSFCEQYGLHPADLVPSIVDPELSYPHAIFRANLSIVDNKNASAEDRKKAHQAVQIEKKRYNDLVKPDKEPMNLLRALDRAVRASQGRRENESFIEAFIGVAGDRECNYLNFAQLVIERAYDVCDAKERKEGRLFERIRNDHSSKRTEFIQALRRTFFGLTVDEQTRLNAEIRNGQEWTEPTLERFLHTRYISDLRHVVGEEFMAAFKVNKEIRIKSDFYRMAALFMEERSLQKKINASTLPAVIKSKELYVELEEWFESGAAVHLRNIVANKIYMDIRDADTQGAAIPDYVTRKIGLE